MTKTNEAQNSGVAIGRRKSAIARVKLVPGTGEVKINSIVALEYFQNSIEAIESCRLPLHIFGLSSTYDLYIQTSGGGFKGQVQAIRLGIARALVHFDISKTYPNRQKGLKDKNLGRQQIFLRSKQ